MRTLTALIVLTLCASDALAATAKPKPQTICVNQKNQLVIKPKCRGKDRALSAALVQERITQLVGDTIIGPTGAPGNKGETGNTGLKGAKGLIDFSGCRIVTDFRSNFGSSSNPAMYLSVPCDPNYEFLYDDDVKPEVIFPDSKGSTVYIQARTTSTATIAGDTREYEASYFVNREKTVGSGTYQVTVRGMCCPR